MNDARAMTVLVVDDEPSNIDLIKGVLPEGVKVKAATNGALALKIAQKVPPPDVILLDVMMPEMDGHEVCQRLKADPATSNIPVVFLSGNDSPDEISKGMEMGALAYLSKPVNPDALNEVLGKIG